MPPAMPGASAPEDQWWRTGVVYQVYPRSFADADGDGIGDLPGLISRLDYLADLSIDAIWVSPFYPSPLHDGGYDVADYRGVDPRLGTLDDVRALVAGAHQRGIRVLLDIVPNHTSSEHPWFRELLASPPGSPAWDRYLVRLGRGDGHQQPPNNWPSVFSGDGWSPLPGPDGSPSAWWYLHLFDTTQPDLNWANPEVIAEFEDVLAFWFDLGIDGFRIDVAHGLVKDPALPDDPAADAPPADPAATGDDDGLLSERRTPYWDQDGVHAIYRGWRAIADSYDPPRVFCGEAWVESEERLARYLRPDELHTSFNFEFLKAGWDAERMREVIDHTITTHAAIGAPPTWVLSNHDVIRHRTRLAPQGADGEPDLDRGLLRARAATALILALPGSAYLYQGEELGLVEADLPDDARQDPAWHRSGGTDGFRDGCRVPIPWGGVTASYGFGPADQSWLPQPPAWAALSVAVQEDDPESTLRFYRGILRLRRSQAALHDGSLSWIPELEHHPDALGLTRQGAQGPGVHVIVNLGDQPLHLPAGLGTEVLIGSSDQVVSLNAPDQPEQGSPAQTQAHLVIGPDTCVWLRG
ncbi:MAG: glycoside hydrolase family 13 protein [Actinomycetales bacterium]|nr:glycoside hydrolase family 13 protein [Actinomycetales bacterium]